MLNGMICVNNYWDSHYSKGGRSGEGDTNASRDWKMKILQEYGLKHNNSIIDVGCGDMEFWENYSAINYTGIDISPTIILQNHNRFPKYKFYCNDSSVPLKITSDYVTCFDMLFHIMDTTKYIMTLSNLVYYTNKKLFIYTWCKNPFDNFKNKLLIGKPFARNVITDGKFQYYRNFDAYSIRYIEPYLKLINIQTDNRWPYGAMYIYEKIESNL
jgi:hypothetical protein